MTFTSTEQKLDYLLNLESISSLDAETLARVRTLVCDANPEVRLRAVEPLALFPSAETELLLLSCLNDSDALVRASVCDSLSFSQSPAVERALMRRARDRNRLVRGYAVLSLADVRRNMQSDHTETVGFLKTLEAGETSPWVKTALYRSLFLLGESAYGGALLHMLKNRSYQIRCFAAELLKQLIEDGFASQLPELKSTLEQSLQTEQAVSVQEKLRAALKDTQRHMR